MHFSIDRTVHTTAFDKPVVDHWLERKIEIKVANWHHFGSKYYLVGFEQIRKVTSTEI